MKLSHLKGKVPELLYDILQKKGITELRPAQEKAIKAELLNRKNLLICTPTSSGKTLVAELAAFNSIFTHRGKAIYIAPLKSLATEKYKEFKEFYGKNAKIGLSIGDVDEIDPRLNDYDFIILTSEKADSLLRHKVDWIIDVAVVIIDEIHLLNDSSRGPTLEILITILKEKLKNVQIIGLSATIGNPEELSKWLNATLIIDDWRPVKLYKGTYMQGKVELE